MDFQRGPYGEILPPPLVAGLHPDELIKQLVGGEQGVASLLPQGNREDWQTLAMLQAHQQRLREAIAGRLQGDPDGQALHQAVVVEGEPMSLRPLGMEQLIFPSFVPVLQRAADNRRWQIGVEGQGGSMTMTAPIGDVVRVAQEVYVAWAEADFNRWQAKVERALAQVPRSLLHEFWAGWLSSSGYWQCGEFSLVRDAETLLLHTPDSVRFLSLSAVEAVHVCDALARQAGAVPDSMPTTPKQIIQWLQAKGVPLPKGKDTHWRIGQVEITWSGWRNDGAALALFETAGAEQDCVLIRQGNIVKLVRNEHCLAETALPSNWLESKHGLVVLAMWAVEQTRGHAREKEMDG
jgi:hypothetical protein